MAGTLGLAVKRPGVKPVAPWKALRAIMALVAGSRGVNSQTDARTGRVESPECSSTRSSAAAVVFRRLRREEFWEKAGKFE